MHWRALCSCLALRVKSLLVFILLNETLEEEAAEEKKKEKRVRREVAGDIF